MEAIIETIQEYYLQEDVIEPIIQEEIREYNLFKVMGLSIKQYFMIGKNISTSDNNSFLFY
jgi:hypothetical protein